MPPVSFQWRNALERLCAHMETDALAAGFPHERRQQPATADSALSRNARELCLVSLRSSWRTRDQNLAFRKIELSSVSCRRCEMTRRQIVTLLFVSLPLIGGACSKSDKARGPMVARAVTPRDTAGKSTLEPGALSTVPRAAVMNWKGPGGKPFEVTVRTADPASALSRKFGTISLRTSLRTRAADLGQYPCTSCHLGRKIILKDERRKDAHQNIKPVHPAQTGALCSTCHSADNVEMLTLKSGERATLDHTYRLCAQCHFSQAESWAGGAHGKRLDGWQGRRVVTGCADCHDPHDPTVGKRVPFRAPQLEKPRDHDK